MSIDNLFGLPAHPLVVHAAVVVLPLAAIGTLVVAVVPRWRRPYGLIVLAASLLSVVAVWVAEERASRSRSIQLAARVQPGAVTRAIVAAPIVVIDRCRDRCPTITRRAVTITVLVAAAITATGATSTIAEVGHSGARATWHQVPISGAG